MNKQKIFNTMIEDNLYNGKSFLFDEDEGELISDKGSILLKDKSNKLHYLLMIPYESEGEQIHGNNRNKLAKEFINKYTFNYLKDLHNKQIEIQKKHLQLEEENKTKLEDLYSSISYMEKYNNNNRYSFDGGVKFLYGSFKKYCIEFNCSKDNYSSDNIRISNNESKDKFDFKFNETIIELTEKEVIQKIKNLSEIYEKVFQEKKEIEECNKQKELRKIKLQNKLFKLYSLSSENEILFKNKKTFIGIKNGMRYAVGEGKAGKYYRCDYYKLCELINKKNITEYIIVDKNINTYTLSNKELKNLKYIKII
ncbi:TPA: hypothetical protein ACXDAY_002300 [Clostridium botulinum]|uniref:hypothetical protein n=1 Tax=Clostridium botulinum TaxID=1491 RepID=UPI0007738F94|nr:hypothetical protein [Clostridium botulinum]AUN01412.1 hypothetical protein RSJ19_00075 [Clostridium botulinum]MBN3359390.1 hypothetical protein [Clostridium botulinum]MBN3367218.1 hypothetical protein [Clostridium botulinum]MBN3371602.1 hypothetical protein [Clostridium botulinum]MBN3376547.1 hypothetical protein [Clostridium botulinum]